SDPPHRLASGKSDCVFIRSIPSHRLRRAKSANPYKIYAGVSAVLSNVALGQVHVIGPLLSQLGMKHFQRKVLPFLKFLPENGRLNSEKSRTIDAKATKGRLWSRYSSC